MKKFKPTFTKYQSDNPGWSSLTCFNQTVNNRNFSKRIIYYWFNKLVDKNDYSQSNKKEIMEFTLEITKKDRGEGTKRG